MCMECFNHRTTSRKEIQELLQKAIDTVEHYYSVTIPTTKVAFKSADSIREACGIVGPGRVLGFYNLRRKIVWIEKGGPEPCVLSTLMHELTHAWQHHDRTFDRTLQRMLRKFPRKKTRWSAPR